MSSLLSIFTSFFAYVSGTQRICNNVPDTNSSYQFETLSLSSLEYEINRAQGNEKEFEEFDSSQEIHLPVIISYEENESDLGSFDNQSSSDSVHDSN